MKTVEKTDELLKLANQIITTSIPDFSPSRWEWVEKYREYNEIVDVKHSIPHVIHDNNAPDLLRLLTELYHNSRLSEHPDHIKLSEEVRMAIEKPRNWHQISFLIYHLQCAYNIRIDDGNEIQLHHIKEAIEYAGSGFSPDSDNIGHKIWCLKAAYYFRRQEAELSKDEGSTDKINHLINDFERLLAQLKQSEFGEGMTIVA